MKLNLVQVEALSAFTVTTKQGQFHGDPDNHSERVQKPMVPEDAVQDLVNRGYVKPIGAKAPPKAARKAPASAAPASSDNAKADNSTPAKSPLAALRDEYKQLVGKNPSPRLDADGLKARIAELNADPDALAAAKAPAASAKPKARASAKKAVKTPRVESDAPVE